MKIIVRFDDPYAPLQAKCQAINAEDINALLARVRAAGGFEYSFETETGALKRVFVPEHRIRGYQLTHPALTREDD